MGELQTQEGGMDGTNIDGRSWDTSGPYHYQRDAHPSFTVRSGHLIVASVFCSDGLEAGHRRARLIAAAPGMLAALDAAEEILRYCPDISTNVNGTRRLMNTCYALAEVRAALRAAGYEVK